MCLALLSAFLALPVQRAEVEVPPVFVFAAEAQDNVGVKRVEFWVQPETGPQRERYARLAGTSYFAPWRVTVNAPELGLGDGFYTLIALAWDEAGNHGDAVKLVRIRQ